jgi:hypothetical protein
MWGFGVMVSFNVPVFAVLQIVQQHVDGLEEEAFYLLT